MPKFAFIFRGGGVVEAGLSPTELQAHLVKWRTWIAGLIKDGKAEGGQALELGGKTVRGHDKVVSDGPFVESKDLVTGSLVVIADSLDEATALSMGCPVFLFGGSVEVRPIATMG